MGIKKRKATVALIFNEENEVLLLKRTGEHKHFPNEWCLPGGKIDMCGEGRALDEGTCAYPYPEGYGETAEESIYEEVLEETGISMTVFESTGLILHDTKFLVYVFIALGIYRPDTSMFPNREHVSCQWFPLDDLPELCGHMTRELLSNVRHKYAFI